MTSARRDRSLGLQDTQAKTKSVEVDIRKAADHAAVIGTVLAQELPAAVRVGDVAQAIAQTEELEHKLTESAQTLAEVTAELGREVKKNHIASKRLPKSRATLGSLPVAGRRARKP